MLFTGKLLTYGFSYGFYVINAVKDVTTYYPVTILTRHLMTTPAYNSLNYPKIFEPYWLIVPYT